MLYNYLFFSIAKEPLTTTRLENNTKLEKPKPLRRKTVADGFIAPLVDSKGTQHPATKGTQYNGSLCHAKKYKFALRVLLLIFLY